MTDTPRISWKVKAVGLLMGLGLGLRWLAGQRPDAVDQAMSDMLMATDWLLLTALFCAALLLPMRAVMRLVTRRRARFRREPDRCGP